MIAIPGDVTTLIAQADALRDKGQLDDALVAYRAIVAEFPESHEARYKLGVCFARLNRAEDAVRCYREAIELWSDYPEANNNLGLILVSRGEFDEAERCYRVALAERTDFLEAHLNLCGLLNDKAFLLEAKYYANRALMLNPQSPAAYARLGQVLRTSGQITAALAQFQHAIELDPKYVSAMTDLGACYWQLGRHDEAEKLLLRALAEDPKCFPAWNNLLLISNYRLLDRFSIFNLHKSYGVIVRKQCGEMEARQFAARPDSNRRLRIGFISGDLRRHSVSYFLRGAVEHLDRQQFQLFAYYNFRTEDAVTWQLKPAFHHWRSIYGVSDENVAGLIQEDRIDILVDLSGHTASMRPMVLGRRPAPIQVHWIGYPNTTGLDCIDYRITDAWADPVGDADQYFSEKLWRLPGSFLCFTPSEAAPELAAPPCVERGYVTFGSFNSRAKLSDECVALWCQVLSSMPDSRLVLKSVFGSGDDAARASLRDCFESRGIAPERVDVLAARGAVEDHFAAYHDIDIALDTFPYNGTTTTCEALWMGVPVVTLAGDRHASRVGVSLLNNVGLTELIAADSEAYVQVALELATDPSRLISLRATMRERLSASNLLDRRAMGVNLGSAFRAMWERHCSRFASSLPIEVSDVDQSVDLIKLHICGQEVRDGWKILDAMPRDGVDFIGDIRNLSAFADESCSEVYCAHVLVRVGQTEILDVLNGIYRILSPGGLLYLSVPDIDVLAWLFINPSLGKPDRFRVMRMIFGGQMDEFDFHRIGLNFDFIIDYLRDVGFANVEHVESFGLFNDASDFELFGQRISLNLIAVK